MRTGRSIVRIAWGCKTHTGKVRHLNEDSLLVTPPIFVVADGMGGHDGGEVASALAVGTMASLQGRSGLDRASILDTVRSANRVIHEHSGGGSRGMGTTLTGLVVTSLQPGHELASLNVGDSRTYRYRDGVLTQITVDHSHVQELIDAGLLDPADAAHHAERNVVTRALGIDDEVEVDLQPVATSVGDRFLVCSDGVSGELRDEQIVDALNTPDPASAASALLAVVLRGRAADNASMIVLDVLEIRDDPAADRTNPRHTVPERRRDFADAPTDPRRVSSKTGAAMPVKRSDALEQAQADPIQSRMIVGIPHVDGRGVASDADPDSAVPKAEIMIDEIPALSSETPAAIAYFDSVDVPVPPALDSTTADFSAEPGQDVDR